MSFSQNMKIKRKIYKCNIFHERKQYLGYGEEIFFFLDIFHSTFCCSRKIFPE